LLEQRNSWGLAFCRIQAQATSKELQELADMQMQKEVFVCALILGCTVYIAGFHPRDQ